MNARSLLLTGIAVLAASLAVPAACAQSAQAALAMSYARKARETQDPAWLDKADAAIDESLKLQPANFEALRVRAFVLLNRHEFAQALELAQSLHRQIPDDLVARAYIADAHIGLGNFQQAVEATQGILNLRPNSLEGLTRAAQLREIHGDLHGALEWTRKAFDLTPANDAEERAWLLTRMAHLQLLSGSLSEADATLNAALALIPDYPWALAERDALRK